MSGAQADEFEGGVPFNLEEAIARREKFVQGCKDIDIELSDRSLTEKNRQQLVKAKRENERQISLLNGWVRREAPVEGATAKFRDDFAKAALRWVNPDLSVEEAAQRAYEMADAMLVERERRMGT